MPDILDARHLFKDSTHQGEYLYNLSKIKLQTELKVLNLSSNIFATDQSTDEKRVDLFKTVSKEWHEVKKSPQALQELDLNLDEEDEYMDLNASQKTAVVTAVTKHITKLVSNFG